MKTCHECLTEKPPDCFYKNRSTSDRLSLRCVSCCLISAKSNPISMKDRPCSKCGGRKHSSGAYCRPCAAEFARQWRKDNRSQHLETQRRSDRKRWSANVAKYSAKRRERQIRWKLAHPEEYKKQALAKYHRTRQRAIHKLGDVCACCGEHRKTMLEIDHIYNDGYIERAGRRNYSGRLARKVVVMKDAATRYQVLCSNCNHSKSRNRGVCEHQQETDRVSMAECP